MNNDSQLDVLDEAYLSLGKLGISDRLVIYLACTFADDLLRLLVLLSPYGGLGAGVAWLIDAVVSFPVKLFFRNWTPS